MVNYKDIELCNNKDQRYDISGPDSESDGIVNIFDITAIARAFNTVWDQTDVNRDGVVNILDISKVAR